MLQFVQCFFTFSLDGNVDKTCALIDVVDLLIKLQGWLVLSVVDVDDGARFSAQQRVHRHAQLHMETLSPLKHLVIINNDGAHLGVLTLVKLNLWFNGTRVVLVNFCSCSYLNF